MNPAVAFFAHGDPKGQPRVRAFVRGRHAGVYDPGTAESWKNAVRFACPVKRSMGGEPYFTGPVSVTLNFRFQRPTGHHVAGKRDRPVKPNAPQLHTSKPDADNAAKAVMDALDVCGVWYDDAQVASLIVTKAYTTGQPGCKVKIEECE